MCVSVQQDLFEQSKQLAEGAALSWGKPRTSSELTRSARAKSSSSSSSGRPSKRVPVAGSSEGLERDARRKWAEAERLAKQAARDVLQGAEVVCATCSGAGDPLLSDL